MASKASVLVLSTAVDPATDAVVHALHNLETEVTRIDTETFPYVTMGTAAFDELGARLPWGSPDSIFYRRIRSPAAPSGVTPEVHDYTCHEAKTFLVGSVLASECPTMSRPEAIWASENKLHQLQVARRCGLRVPSTVVTNDRSKVREFFTTCSGRMVVKPLRSGYVEIDGEPRAVFTNRVLEEHLDRLDSSVPCPSIYQELVEKACDVRVTYVDGELFTAEIDSQSDPDATVDWRRTSDPNLPHRTAALPEALIPRLSRFMQQLKLVFGALDFIKTPDGKYIFLEVNPNGQWLWLEDRLGFSVSSRIADWLTSHAGSNQ